MVFTSWIKTLMQVSRMGVTRKMMDTQVHVESDSSSVDDTDLAAGAILVPDFKNNPDQDDIFATPWEKEHYLKYFPRQTRPSDRYYAIMMS